MHINSRISSTGSFVVVDSSQLVEIMAVVARRILVTLVILISTIGLVHCGGGSSSKDSDDSVPVNVSLEDVQLIAGKPTTIIYTIPAADRPYTQITIDLNRSLREADLVVTPTP